MSRNRLDAKTVERFRSDVERLAGSPPSAERKLALAVSGGPDSMAMLVLAQAAFPDAVTAATVDHGLRADAADEANMVATHCAKLGVAHLTLTPDTPVEGSSLQMRAREARYALLTKWATDQAAHALVTAHHADDQAETLLMRLARGSGISGLSAIRAARAEQGVWLIRPLLDWRRAELRQVARLTGTPFVDDPSNQDTRHDRTRYRAMLNREEALLDPEALTASAQWLAEADAALEAITDRLWAERWLSRWEIMSAMDQPREIQRRLVKRALAEVRDRHGIVLPAFSSASNIEPLLDALNLGQRATHGGIMVTPNGGEWHFRPAPPRRSH